jgi:hypothetical protein
VNQSVLFFYFGAFWSELSPFYWTHLPIEGIIARQNVNNCQKIWFPGIRRQKSQKFLTDFSIRLNTYSRTLLKN